MYVVVISINFIFQPYSLYILIPKYPAGSPGAMLRWPCAAVLLHHGRAASVAAPFGEAAQWAAKSVPEAERRSKNGGKPWESMGKHGKPWENGG